MKKIYLLSFLILILGFSFAQQGEIQGTTLSGIPAITKSVSEVVAFEKMHPLTAQLKAPLRPELEGPTPTMQDPNAINASRSGTLLTNGGTTSPLINISSTPAFSNFLAIWGSYANVPGRESPYTPPDNCGDVGFTQMIATANTRLKVFTKPAAIGTPVTTTTNSSTTTLTSLVNFDLNVFFTNVSLGISGISDPHVRFDRLTGRWFVVAIDVNHTVNNYCCIGVSDGPAISSTSNFKLYYFNVSQTGGSASDFFDYPTLGIDDKSLYIGGNMFFNQSSFSGSNMWVVNKAKLIAGTLSVTGFPQSATGTDMYTPQGVQNDDAASINGYFIGSSQTFYSKLVIRRVSYTSANPTLSGDLNLTTQTMYRPNSVPTLSGTSIDGGDARPFAAMIKKNKITGSTSLWTAQCTLLNSSGIGGSAGDRDGALWFEIGNLSTTPSILQSATLSDRVNPSCAVINYIYPTIAMSGQGHCLMGFTSAGASYYCQAASANRFRTSGAGVFNSPLNFTTATSPYNPGIGRWGDFTQTVVDPLDDMTMWTFTEYAPTTNAWGVRAAQFKAPPPAKPSLASVPACGVSTVTINGTSTNNSEFYDPGVSGGSYNFHHLQVIVTGPGTVTVSNVVFVSPLQITATFNTHGIPSGKYSVFVYNPDGQRDSTSFTYSSACTIRSGGVAAPDITAGDSKPEYKTRIYPDPVTETLNVVNANGGKAVIQIMDNSGNLIKQIHTSSVNSAIKVSNLSSGTYIVKIVNNNKVQVKKFIKI